MNLRPMGNRISILRVKEKDKTETGIIIPDTAKRQPTEGRVAAVGYDCMYVKIDDRIIFSEHSGLIITDRDGSEYLIMREDEVLGVVE